MLLTLSESKRPRFQFYKVSAIILSGQAGDYFSSYYVGDSGYVGELRDNEILATYIIPLSPVIQPFVPDFEYPFLPRLFVARYQVADGHL
jgi:hypothetical protein